MNKKIILLVASLTAAGCVPVQIREAASVSGSVTTTSGQPIVGAKVFYAEFPSDAVQSGEQGGFTLAEIKRRHWLPLGFDVITPCPHLVISAPGFEEHRECVQVYNPTPRNVVLSESSK
ncbi:MAG TPA: carboxypeptidase-like regulatory domain-containing protein [Solimonas sp.]|nr:carboxypeptidase-like regulatory domain-containing protein [Solimonas sp.]